MVSLGTRMQCRQGDSDVMQANMLPASTTHAGGVHTVDPLDSPAGPCPGTTHVYQVTGPVLSSVPMPAGGMSSVPQTHMKLEKGYLLVQSDFQSTLWRSCACGAVTIVRNNGSFNHVLDR
jgi:hypothetical protein